MRRIRYRPPQILNLSDFKTPNSRQLVLNMCYIPFGSHSFGTLVGQRTMII